MNTIQTQTADVLDYLQQGHAITQLKALRLFGCMRLGARIYDLREDGYKIKTKRVKQNGKSFASYSLERKSA